MTESPLPAPAELTALLDRWVAQQLITSEQADRIRAAERATLPHARADANVQRNRLVIEALAYLGAVTVLVAGALLTQMIWADLSSGARVGVTAATFVVLFAAGAVMRPATDSTRRMRSVLWLMAVAAAGAAAAVIGDQWLGTVDEDTAQLAGLAALVVAVPLYRLTRSAAQQAGLLGGSLVTASALGGQAHWDEPTLAGLGVWLVGVGWFVAAERRLLRPEVVARYAGAIAAVIGALMLSGAAAGHVVLVATIAAVFTWGVRQESLGLLAVATVGTLQAIPAIVTFFFPDNDRAAVPVVLLAIGAVLLAAAVTVSRHRSRHPEE